MPSTEPSAQQLEQYQKAQNGRVDVCSSSDGVPVASKTASLTLGPRGPLLLQDHVFLDEMAHFDRERIPERVVHAKGAGAFGYFEVTHDVTSVCCAQVFAGIGRRTPVAVRFSTVGGESGSADTVRDPRGFAVKFYTPAGNWDLVGNNTPIFFIRDPLLFPSFIHTQKRNPVTHLKDADMFWDFITLRPETTHQVMFLFGDRGLPDGYRHMNGYGSHTFRLVNSDGAGTLCKFHLKTDQGVQNLSVERAAQLVAADPDYATRDLYNAIASGRQPSWSLQLQLMSEQQAQQVDFDPLDVTKVWPQGMFPLRPVGRLVLDKNPDNYFAQVEQLAFSPAHLPPGIEPSADKMLQGRLFAYTDTHRYRLGTNYQQLPVNRPHTDAPAGSYLRDGAMTLGTNQAGAPNYFPNSFGGAQVLAQTPPATAAAAAKSDGVCYAGVAARYETADADNFSQARVFYQRVLNDQQRRALAANIASHLQHAKLFIQKRAVANFGMVDADFGDNLQQELALLQGINVQELRSSL